MQKLFIGRNKTGGHASIRDAVLSSSSASAGFADGRAVRRSTLAGVFHTAYYPATVPQEETHA